jgi:hypothetical protein
MKEAKEYWESLSIKQQDHFLKDHKNEFNRSSWLGWLGKDFDKLPANVQKVISKHVEEGVYKSGGSFSDFLAKAKTKAKSAYSSTKKGAKELSVKAKDTYSKTEKAVKDKVKEQKRKIAVDVINDTDNKVKTKEEHIYLDRARQIVVNKYANGGGIVNEWVVNFASGSDYKTKYVKASSESEAIDKGFRLISEDGEDSDEYSVESVYKTYANGGGVGTPIEQMIANANHEKYVKFIINSLEENGYTNSEAIETCKKFDKEIIEYKKQLMYPSEVANKLQSKELEYAKGTNIKKVDLFEYYDLVPANVEKVLDRYSEAFEDGDYQRLEEAQSELENIGYTFEFGLDGQAYALRPIGVKVSELEGYEKYCCGGQMYKTGGDLKTTKYVFVNFVQGNYGYGWEDLTAHDTRLEAKKEMKVYDENERYSHRVITRRILRTDYEQGKYAKGTNIDTDEYKYVAKYSFNKDESPLQKDILRWGNSVKDVLVKKSYSPYQEHFGILAYAKNKVAAAKLIKEWSNYGINWLHISDFTKEEKYAKGGHFENENREMVLNNNKQIAHHTKELQDAVKGKRVPAWVVAKVNRSASDLSDATHYMEGQSEKYAKGSTIKSDNLQELKPLNEALKSLGMKYNSERSEFIDRYENELNDIIYFDNAKTIDDWKESLADRMPSALTQYRIYPERYAKGTNLSSDWTKQLTNDENELACSIMNRIVKPGPYVDCNNLKYAVKSELKKAVEKNMNMFSADGKKIATSLLSKLN